MVKREPEWDDESREEMLALAIYRAGICACGFHESLATDKANHFAFENKHCPICERSAQYGRVKAADEEKAIEAMGKDPAPARKRPSDGVRTYVRMKSPAEVAAEKLAAANGVAE